jgi:putative phosphoribosyl transferase
MNRVTVKDQHIQIATNGVLLEGTLNLPQEPIGIVAFVHGSGSSRHSPRNQAVAKALQAGRLGTLLFDLLTAEEERIDVITRHLRFDIDLLARRTAGAIDWLGQQPNVQRLPVGLFGASTGAAAALMAAAHRSQVVRAVVSRGGRPDLAGPALGQVQCAVLLIVGSLDEVVIDLNKRAMAQMRSDGDKKLLIIPGATHLFEEPGTLEQVFRLAKDWFEEHLTGANVGPSTR